MSPVDSDGTFGKRPEDVGSYFQGVAQARFAIRKSFRIVDEEARVHGLEPLQHQALIQVLGAGDHPVTISHLAARLDIVPALASRLVRSLTEAGHLVRKQSMEDRRLAHVAITDKGTDVLLDIMSGVELKIALFQRQLEPDERVSALLILGIYVGVPLEREALHALVDRVGVAKSS